MKESTGWQQVFASPRLDWLIDRVALNAKVMGGSLGDNDKMVAVASGTEIILWSICPDGNGNEIGEHGRRRRLLPRPRHPATTVLTSVLTSGCDAFPRRLWPQCAGGGSVLRW